MFENNPTATINLDNLTHNLSIAKKESAGKVMAIIKANAYGHTYGHIGNSNQNHNSGLQEVIHALNIADGFGVARLEEALEVRHFTSHHPVLVLTGIFNSLELKVCLAEKLDIVVHNLEQVELIKNHQTQSDKQLTVWLKMDSGMHRLGLAPEQFLEAYKSLEQSPIVNNIIAMTHFSSADENDSDNNNEYSAAQIEIFNETLKQLNITAETSLSNSAGILNPTIDENQNWVRPGLMLYGVSPNKTFPQSKKLKPVMSLQAPVIGLRTIEKGESVGYNHTWAAEKPSVIATVAIGYGDGYPTQITRDTPVLINGEQATIVGRVSMDSITVDCSHIKNIKVGDTVTLWGDTLRGDSVAIEDIALKAQTIPYDLMTGLTNRVKRVY